MNRNGTKVDLKETVELKFRDAMTPGFMAEFDPDEAEFAGAFVEDSISEEDALDSAFDIEHDLQQQEQKEG